MEHTITILYEDSDCLFINKPAGISMHGDGKTPEYTIADWILETYPLLAQAGEPMHIKIKGEDIVVPKPGIVHRLDKETSGVVLIAKSQTAYEFFKKQFQEREIKKIYHCFAYGWPKKDFETIDGSIGRDSGDVRKWTSGRTARGTLRDARTDIQVLSRFGEGEYEGKGNTKEGAYSFIEARPKTGRTHQIRVHLRSINHPIVCDSLYAPKRAPALGFTRLALHARSLTAALPDGSVKTIEAPYPADFEQALSVAKG
jgi:23S rRNA pseudouridine1911/1915/1917 synthase